MNERQRLPNRRPCWRLKFVWETETGGTFPFFGTISYFGPWHEPDLKRPAEIFIDSSKTTQLMALMAAESAILVSHALQRGASLQELLDAVPKVPHPQKGEVPATAIGTLLQLIADGKFVPEGIDPAQLKLVRVGGEPLPTVPGLAETGVGRPDGPGEVSQGPEPPAAV